MNAIEKIIAQMKEQATAEQAALEQERRQQIDDDFQAGEISLMNDFEKQKQKQTVNIDGKYRQLRNRQQVEIRQETLNEKQQFLGQLFQQASDQMEQWGAAETQAFAKNALLSIPLEAAAVFIPGEKSRQHLSAEWLEAVNQELAFPLVYGETTVPERAGFIVDDQGVQYNFIFQSLVKDVQEQMAYEIAGQLFGQST